MNVTACLVTRGDVDMQPILDSLPDEWEIIVWDNSPIQTFAPDYVIYNHNVRQVGPRAQGGVDLSVFGRYAAIEYATNDLIYVQDDDVIVSESQAIVDAWRQWEDRPDDGEIHPHSGYVVCNQPQEFRYDFYSDHSLVGFGAAFYRDAPKRAFARFKEHSIRERGGLCRTIDEEAIDVARFNRCCDIVFTGLTPCVRVDVPKENLPHAYADDRMWRQPTHQAERQRMLALVRRVRDER